MSALSGPLGGCGGASLLVVRPNRPPPPFPAGPWPWAGRGRFRGAGMMDGCCGRCGEGMTVVFGRLWCGLCWEYQGDE